MRSTPKQIQMIWGLEIFSNHFCLTINRLFSAISQDMGISPLSEKTELCTAKKGKIFFENEVVWTFLKFKICLYFWGVFGPWRGSVASYTTDERSKNGQKERWRLNLEELKLRSRLNFYEIQDLPLFLRRFWALKRECSELHDRWKGKKRPKRKVKIEFRRAQSPNQIFVRKV